MTEDCDRLLTIAELAAYVGVPVPTVHRWNHQGTAPTRLRIGKHVRYRLSDVEDWLNRRTVP